MDGEHATIERDGSVRSGHKGSHMTAPTQRIEVITRGERRRRWSIEEKREIVAESLGTGIRPSEVIHKYGITSGQLYAWRQQLTRRVDGQSARPPASFARVDVVTGERKVQAASGDGDVGGGNQTTGPRAGDCYAACQGIDRDRAARRHLGSRGRACR